MVNLDVNLSQISRSLSSVSKRRYLGDSAAKRRGGIPAGGPDAFGGGVSNCHAGGWIEIWLLHPRMGVLHELELRAFRRAVSEMRSEQ